MVLEKYQPTCVFCHSDQDLVEYKGKNVLPEMPTGTGVSDSPAGREVSRNCGKAAQKGCCENGKKKLYKFLRFVQFCLFFSEKTVDKPL